MEIEKLIEAIKLCGSTPSVYQCKQCAYWAGGDMSQCIPRMAADVADTLEQLQAENEGLKEEVKQMRWIPVEERKPKPSDNPILIYKSWDGRANFIGTAWYSSFHGWIPTNGTKIYGVTHWMPLPQPPKEDNL